MNYFNKLVHNNTGVSSKNFFLVCVTLVGILLLLVPVIVILWEMWKNGSVGTNINDWAAYIAAVAGVFTSAGITKAWSEMSEKKAVEKDEKTEGDGGQKLSDAK